ncbi:hypothetical protein NLA06_05590 [Desulfomicrobium sp. ZS1]|uniref:hypothetical protein n=1 Tax=Desulfomicrobium sp. ZS1 TaxID=2952228 RepID=UPI0020B1BC8B|nr:hypothetical protein [Desulfomicrobium sp. ZS1]UTF51362.1 hypothetical protein NLA06_05590 [Desulfomicrobium sp. ZS1]
MITNFYRIEIPFESFQIQQIPYSESAWASLKKEYNKLASFFRNKNFIYISPCKGLNLDIGNFVTLNVADNTSIIISLIRHLVFRKFREEFPERIPQSFSPLRFFSTKNEHDAIRKLLPRELQGIVRFQRMVEVEARHITEARSLSFGLLIRSRQRWQFDATLDELYDQGFDLIGKSVLESHDIPGLEGVLAPEEELLGEIQSVTDRSAEIVSNDGTIQRELRMLRMQRTQNQIGAYLAFRLGDKSVTQIFKNIQQDRRYREQPGSSFGEINKFAGWFAGSATAPRFYENNDGFYFTVTDNNRFDGVSIPLQRTNLVFDYGPGASATSPLRGLADYGPFNSERFECNNLRMLAICHPQSRGAMTQFTKQLIDGIPESRYFKRGLKSLFRLTSVIPTIKEVKNLSPEAYEVAIDEAIRDSKESGFDLVLVECPEGSKQIAICENPYYRARVRSMSYGIPTQGVTSEHLRSPQTALEWTLAPMALQIYAKAGGTPWRLPATQSVDREIIVGIGSALERPNLWAGAEQSRVVGITTFFLGDGSYMLGERLRSIPYCEYFSELLNSLKSSIESVAQEYAWRVGDTVRIVFHIFKPIKNIEADVVADLINSFPQFNILFAFVTISIQHPWMMFRDSFIKQGKTSVTLCERGDNLIIDTHNCLLQLRGDKDRPNKQHRPPFPVLIRIHEKSTFTDLKYIVQQIQDFSFLSWRSFFPCEIPVTVFYSDLIASEAGKLSKVPLWQPTFLEQHFRRKQWFL